MRYYLKKDLPGIKAGTEMEKGVGFSGWDGEAWRTADRKRTCFVPIDELSEWIEERENSMWKPKMVEIYYIPMPIDTKEYCQLVWTNDEYDNLHLSRHLVCPTPELAIELRDRMLETAKKFWEEKE